MNERTYFAACTVFEDKIVVSGGVKGFTMVNSVEAYDHYENKQTYLPDIIKSRSQHSLGSLSNKLFIIDRVNRKFSYIIIDIFSRALRYNWKTRVCCVGYKIIVYMYTSGGEYKSVVYDTNNK